MSRQSARGRPQCSSSSAGSASYQGISGATSPVYHLPQDPFDFNSFRKKPHYPEETQIQIPHHNYYNIQQSQCCPNPKDSIADTHSYQYLNERDERKSYGNVDTAFSDDSSFYEFNRRGQNYSEYESDFPIAHQFQKPTTKKSFQKQDLRYQSSRSSSNPHSHGLKENHVVVNQDCLRGGLDRVYPEQPLTRAIGDDFQNSLPRRGERMSERGVSPDSAVGSAIVDGCGGHCVVFENVCSYVLQIFFVMGILIGTSLCIAGIVLRRTKSRDLQVLVYIGAMSAMVCTLLLVVQCRVRRSLRNRKRAVRQARAMTIPMGDMRQQIGVQPGVQVCQPLITSRVEDRAIIMPVNLQPRVQEVMNEQQGVPWWRRNDLPANNRL